MTYTPVPVVAVKIAPGPPRLIGNRYNPRPWLSLLFFPAHRARVTGHRPPGKPEDAGGSPVPVVEIANMAVLGSDPQVCDFCYGKRE